MFTPRDTINSSTGSELSTQQWRGIGAYIGFELFQCHLILYLSNHCVLSSAGEETPIESQRWRPRQGISTVRRFHTSELNTRSATAYNLQGLCVLFFSTWGKTNSRKPADEICAPILARKVTTSVWPWIAATCSGVFPSTRWTKEWPCWRSCSIRKTFPDSAAECIIIQLSLSGDNRPIYKAKLWTRHLLTLEHQAVLKNYEQTLYACQCSRLVASPDVINMVRCFHSFPLRFKGVLTSNRQGMFSRQK